MWGCIVNIVRLIKGAIKSLFESTLLLSDNPFKQVPSLFTDDTHDINPDFLALCLCVFVR